ncbi:MAG: EAL domain-containing protein [Christensenellales bacterium]|jgi:diguanylate cyclase (GGDEF)-like protein
MDGYAIQRRLRRITVIVVLISAVLLLGGSFVTSSLDDILRDAMNTQMQAEAEAYKINIQRQLDADLQTLYTLSSFFKFSDAMDQATFAKGLYESNNHNDFITMGYFDRDGGPGIRVTLNQGIEPSVPLDSLAPQMRRAVEQAWQGQSACSDLFYSDALGQAVFAYAVPVYAGSEVVGALAASESAESMATILQDATAMHGEGYIHLLRQDGSFALRCQRQVIPESLESVFADGYLDEPTRRQMRLTLQQGERGYFPFAYAGQNYRLFLEPVGVNGWYLLLINTLQGINAPLYHIITVTRVTFIAILALSVFLILYGYRLLRRNNKQLIRGAYYDPLTGAYNLTRFTELMAERLARRRDVCVAALNIRQFKFINEIFGKEQADRLLCTVKAVLDRHMTAEEFCCRDTADCFYLLLVESDPEAARARLERILAEAAQAAMDRHTNYQRHLYGGVAMGDQAAAGGDAAASLMTHALFALAKARQGQPQGLCFYDEQLHRAEQLENYVESHMSRALQAGEFKLFLQPKMRLADGALGGAEALVRWVTDRGETLMPDQFIPLFEKNGFCTQLDLYMVAQACRQIRAWIEQGVAPIPISVNQSKLLFYEEGYISSLRALTERFGVPPRLITLEILEGLALGDIQEINGKIAQLQCLGFRVSLDDFGSGYSSLNTLGSLVIDELKLDRAFLLAASGERASRQEAVLEQIVQLTKRLGVVTVVEGVETAQHERLVRALGCDYGQGYYYSRPISAEAFSRRYMGGTDGPGA